MTPLEIAQGEIGYTESPANSNKTKFGKWMGLDGQPWCLSFVQWCYNEAGSPLPYKTGSCSALLNWYKSKYPANVKTEPEPGDIIIYNFGHTGIVESANASTITAIEGNTSAGNSGSQSNGGGVYRRTRNKSLVTAYIRPKEGDDTVTQDDFNTMMSAWLEAQSAREPSEWSEEARSWAEGNGYINGDADGNKKYKKPTTREEMVQMLYNILGGK